MKIVFFGTPEYVVPILNKLHKAFKTPGQKSAVVAVVTQEPKPAGRKKQLVYSAVDTWAHKKEIPIFHTSSDLLKRKIKADLGICASFGEIIPKNAISSFPYGVLNIHPSLLPKFRGASPVQATIILGNVETGVTIIKMDEKLDHGPIISQFRVDAQKDDTTKSLRDRLFEQSSEVLVTLIPAYTQGKIKSRQQNHQEATFTRTISKDDAFISPKYLNASLQGTTPKAKWKIPFIKNFSLQSDAYSLDRFIRAMIPWPIAWSHVLLDGKQKTSKRLKILEAHINGKKLILDEVQLEGKNPVSWEQFTTGYRSFRFG